MGANVFELFATISLDTDEYERKLKDSENKTSTFADVLKANLASGAIIAGVKKLAGVVADVGKAAYTSYARYEQLAGGAQLMFGDAYDFVTEKARNAYNCGSGISAERLFAAGEWICYRPENRPRRQCAGRRRTCRQSYHRRSRRCGGNRKHPRSRTECL